jgi:hypothetical protein
MGGQERRASPGGPSVAPRLLAALVGIVIISIWAFGATGALRGGSDTTTTSAPDSTAVTLIQPAIPGVPLGELLPVTGALAAVVTGDPSAAGHSLWVWPAGAVEPDAVPFPEGFGTLWPAPGGDRIAFGIADPEILAGYARYRFTLYAGTLDQTWRVAEGVESAAWGPDGRLVWTVRGPDGVVTLWEADAPDRPVPRRVAAVPGGRMLLDADAAGYWFGRAGSPLTAPEPGDGVLYLDASDGVVQRFGGFFDARAGRGGPAVLVGPAAGGLVVGWWDGDTVRRRALAVEGADLRYGVAAGAPPPGRAAVWVETSGGTEVHLVGADGGSSTVFDLDGAVESLHWDPSGSALVAGVRRGTRHAVLHYGVQTGSVFGVELPETVITAWAAPG